MRKITTLFCVLFLVCHFSQAQFKQIAEGPKFDEPSRFDPIKIIQLAAGNTFYIAIHRKTLDIRIYDVSHVEKVVTSVVPGAKMSSYQKIESVFEIDNNVILFLSDFVEHAPTLYRFIIDGNTGQLLSEQAVIKLGKAGAFESNDQLRSFIVKKDPYSDNYGIGCFDIFPKDRDKRIEVIHYNKDHSEISRAYCVSKNDNKDFFLLLDLVVLGSEKICCFLFENSEIYTLSRRGRLVMGTLEKDSRISYSKLNLPEDIFIGWIGAKYNPTAKNIILLSVQREKKNGGEHTFHGTLIDPVSKESKSFNVGSNDDLNRAYKGRFGGNDDFFASPQNIYINDDETFIIAYQEMRYQITQDFSSTKIGKVAICMYDKNGKYLSGQLVLTPPQWLGPVKPLYHLRGENNTGGDYYSFFYLNSPTKKYVIVNDTKRNDDVKGNKFVEIQSIAQCDAVFYKLTSSVVNPAREYMFGKTPEDSKKHNLVMINGSSFNKKTNVFVTLRYDNEDRRNEKNWLVWLEPQ